MTVKDGDLERHGRVPPEGAKEKTPDLEMQELRAALAEANKEKLRLKLQARKDVSELEGRVKKLEAAVVPTLSKRSPSKRSDGSSCGYTASSASSRDDVGGEDAAREQHKGQLQLSCGSLSASSKVGFFRQLESTLALQSQKEVRVPEPASHLSQKEVRMSEPTSHLVPARNESGELAVLRSLREEAEFWRRSALQLKHQSQEEMKLKTDPTLVKVAKRMMLRSSHTWVTGSKCNVMENLEVHRVDKILNAVSWRRYSQHLQTLSEEHHRYGIGPRDVEDWAGSLDVELPWVRLAKPLNEVLLWHGCKPSAALDIANNGFGSKTKRPDGLEGISFSCQACKGAQSCEKEQSNLRCMLLCRVALGDPAFVESEEVGAISGPSVRMIGSEPMGTHDSLILVPGCEGGRWRQVQHREFVIFKGEQAYPELAIWFTI